MWEFLGIKTDLNQPEDKKDLKDGNPASAWLKPYKSRDEAPFSTGRFGFRNHAAYERRRQIRDLPATARLEDM